MFVYTNVIYTLILIGKLATPGTVKRPPYVLWNINIRIKIPIFFCISLAISHPDDSMNIYAYKKYYQKREIYTTEYNTITR